MAQLKNTIVTGNLSVTDEITAKSVNGARVFYGTCETLADTVAKVVACPEFSASDLVKGAVVFVTITTTNSGAVADLTLEVNSTGAKPLKCLRNGAVNTLPAVGYLLADQTYMFVYDGTNWVTVVDYNSDTNTKVTQTNRTTNATYNVLFSVDTYTTTAKTNSTYKSNNLIFNPSTGLLTVSGDVKSHGKACIYGEYASSTAPSSPVTGQIWYKDADMTIEEAKVLVVSTTASSLPTTISNASITEDMELIRGELGTSSVQGGDLTVTTSAGSVTISGTISGSTTIKLWLMRGR